MRKTITASEGHILTNGIVYGYIIHLAEGMDASEFYEIPEEEYALITASEEATAEDYECALGEFGVKV